MMCSLLIGVMALGKVTPALAGKQQQMIWKKQQKKAPDREKTANPSVLSLPSQLWRRCGRD
jgi:hypothetical protein